LKKHKREERSKEVWVKDGNKLKREKNGWEGMGRKKMKTGVKFF